MSKFYTKCLETYATFRIQHSLSHITRHPITSLPSITSNITWCHTLLTSVSRSFALVIASLPDDVRLPVTCMYLLLRALDTVEDDMSVPLTTKKQLLLTFHERLHTQKCDDLHGYGDTPECRYLLQQLTRVIDVYQTLPASYRTIITDVVSRMGHGMTEFLRESNDHTQACMEIDTIVEYNLYGHYVAGIVGHALSQLWTTSGHEDISLAQENVLSNSMGLLLQKTNMIRDYREDVTEHRFWWPRKVWSLYGDSLKELGDFPHRSESISCLNHMITDALTHVPDCLDYLSRLHDPRLFASCAIPQVLAFATLSHMYANPLVYTQPLRIPQGLTCHIMIRCRDMKEVSMWMNRFAREMRERVSEKDRGVKRTLDLLTLIQRLSQQHITRAYHPHHVIRRTIHLIIVFFLACFLFMWCLDSATCTSYLISSPAPISWLSLPLVSLSSIKWSPTATATATAVPIPVHTSTVDVTR